MVTRMEKTKATFIALGVLSGGLVLAGLVFLNESGTPQPSPVTQISGLAFEPSDDQRKTISLLRSRVSRENPHFSAEDARKREHAQLFTYMAATSDESHVVRSSLEAILHAYSSRSSKKQAPDADLDQVLIKHLKADDLTIVAQALQAARIPLMSEAPSDSLLAALMQLASEKETPEKRLAALEALNLLAPSMRTEAVLGCFEEALRAPEWYVVSMALFALENSALSLGDPPGPSPALAARVTALTGHEDPAVRGRALSVLSALRWLTSHTERLTFGLRGLSDPHPYVRAVAADLLGQNEMPEAVHALITHTRDLNEARIDVRFPRLDGSLSEMVHALPGRRRVADAALYALLALSTGELALTIGGPTQPEETLQQSAQIADAWYEKSKASLPPLPRASQ
jgi:HEAT repeat protein